MQHGGEVDAETPAPPYPPRRSPDVDRARRHSREWAVEVGILGNAASQWQVWDATEFSGTDLALFAALTHPDARGTELDLFADSYVWSWYLDDLIVERFKRSRDSAGARLFLDRLAGVAADPDRADAGNPAEFGLADLVRRTCAGRDQAWRDRLTGQLPNVFDDALWEIDNLAFGRIPDPVDYITMRRRAGGAGWAAQLVERSLHLELPAAVRGDPVLVRLHEAFADVVDLHNDLVSYLRETEYEQDVSNNVVVTAHFLTTHVGNAATLTHKLMLERLHLFERLVAEATADSPGPCDTRRYLQGLKDWIAGDFAWHQATTRYRPQTWQHRPGRRAALPPLEGLGMAAAELPRRLGRVARCVRGGGDAGLPSMP
ncbi:MULTISPECIES: hypothetical protein [unclassified Streptomyces]|uniref:terpene synthase family protein n=1 Tax=unclassified Streptomyces TaxID=2593676 RepID=UPI0013A6B5AC|nr:MULTISPECIES: hypothetical protein [unclassified Streptomyces]